MSDSKHIHEGDPNHLTTQEHLSEAMQRRYIAALLASTAGDSTWAHATQHLASCAKCREGALRGARELWDSPQWKLLEPGEFARRAQELWIDRLREHPRPPMREAAARELGALEPLGRAGFAALLEAALDPDEGVAEAAATALAEVAARQPFVARLQNWSIESAAVPHALH